MHAVGPGGDRRGAPAAQRLQAVERHRQHAQDGARRASTSCCSPRRRCRTRCWSCSGWSASSTSTPSATCKSFREQFANLSQEQVFETLKARLKPSAIARCGGRSPPTSPTRKRLPLVQEFTPDESEDRLYDLVSDYLQRDNLQALPASQRSLMTLVLRKLLASSTFAIAGALTSISDAAEGEAAQAGAGRIAGRRTRRGLRGAGRNRRGMGRGRAGRAADPMPTARRSKRRSPISTRFAELATSIEHNAKGKALLKALRRRLRQGRRARRRARRRSSSPSRAARRATCCACWPTARSPTASSCSTARTPTTAPSRSTRVARAAPGHRPRHRLAHRRHALRARRLLPRAKAAS